MHHNILLFISIMDFDRNMHLQHKMQFVNFDSWTAFRKDKQYHQHSVLYNGQPTYSPIEGSTEIIRLDNNGRDYSSSYRFTVEKHQTDLFYYLIKRDGFVLVDSHSSNATYVGNGDDCGGYRPISYSIPKSETATYRRKENFPLGHISSKLQQLQLSNVHNFTLEKVSHWMIKSMHYKLIINGEHRMSVDQYQTDAFFQIINEQFTTDDEKHYYRKRLQ